MKLRDIPLLFIAPLIVLIIIIISLAIQKNPHSNLAALGLIIVSILWGIIAVTSFRKDSLKLVQI